MGKLATFVLELLRMCLLLIITIGLLGGLEDAIFKLLYGWTIYPGSAVVGNIILFFVLYRNYWQFRGWFESDKNQRLEQHLTRSLIGLSLLLILLPFAVPLLK
ncbi:hypothetical protein [Paenibacillus riograndensis]|uniref:Putative membrane protein n=1 Tax=Paenibacillus riograndensis SBR5 TaxID=1073571 RepID=A0A0E4HBG2_9BACL|nr:hypothetical protein [Paenibacillus riograndensis]CQR53409.1 putative membrane protein [Paenibacillus riograndensis SBR5]